MTTNTTPEETNLDESATLDEDAELTADYVKSKFFSLMREGMSSSEAILEIRPLLERVPDYEELAEKGRRAMFEEIYGPENAPFMRRQLGLNDDD